VSRYGFGFDIGGTFTDFVLIDGQTGDVQSYKTLTTPRDPSKAVMEGWRELLGRVGATGADVATAIHGTTLITNAFIERKGAVTLLVTTRGFADVLDTQREMRYDIYDLHGGPVPHLVPRFLRFEVDERIDTFGQPLEAFDPAGLEAMLHDLDEAGVTQDVGAVAVAFINAFTNPAHEEAARGWLHAHLPQASVSISSEVAPMIREYERMSTTVANAYVQPLTERYLAAIRNDLREGGFGHDLYLMLSSGGITTVDVAAKFPVRLTESGPAAGALAAAYFGALTGHHDLVGFDMGGTTAKMCLIRDAQPTVTDTFEIARVRRFKRGSGLPVRIPTIELIEIGAGGGSIAQVDSMGRIQVGPESAGADPGPACYGRGGTHPAVTDANLALGRYEPSLFAGGSLPLKPDLSRAALAEHVGGRLGLSGEMAALGVVEMVDENMANAARVHAIESGKGYEGRIVIAFGGGGPVHGYRVAEKIGVKRMLVPSGAGVGSAIGFLRAPVAYEVVKSLYQRFGSFDLAAVNGLLASMSAEATKVVNEGAFGQPVEEARIAYMRYVGQGHEISVPLPARALTAQDVAEIRALYDSEYTRFYDRPVPGSDVEILSFAVTVRTVEADVEPAAPVADSPAPKPIRVQMVRDTATGEVTEWPVYDRDHMNPGATIPGPAIVAEAETSTLVGPGWTCRMDGLGYLDLVQEAA
jgi:N-methylhydantoinase A